MREVYNFSAGPSMLPQEVLEKIKDQLFNFKNSGQSVMEMSHRSSEYDQIHNETKSLLREIMAIPENYEILMFQGGGSTQFHAIPLNLKKRGVATYIITGYWAKKAALEGARYMVTDEIDIGRHEGYAHIPDVSNLSFKPESDYVFIVVNNTICGTRYVEFPKNNIPLVADMSSCILSEPYDVNNFDLIFAAAQKNAGISGVTFVIIKKELIRDDLPPSVPIMENYFAQSKNNSIYNTCPTFAIYVSGLMFKWIKEQGGVESVYAQNIEKARKIYEFLDDSKIFKPIVEPKYRSLMNVVFKTDSSQKDADFIKEAQSVGLINLAGHRFRGGMRASMYNAMPKEGVDALVSFMKKFEINES